MNGHFCLLRAADLPSNTWDSDPSHDTGNILHPFSAPLVTTHPSLSSMTTTYLFTVVRKVLKRSNPLQTYLNSGLENKINPSLSIQVGHLIYIQDQKRGQI